MNSVEVTAAEARLVAFLLGDFSDRKVATAGSLQKLGAPTEACEYHWHRANDADLLSERFRAAGVEPATDEVEDEDESLEKSLARIRAESETVADYFLAVLGRELVDRQGKAAECPLGSAVGDASVLAINAARLLTSDAGFDDALVLARIAERACLVYFYG